MLASAPSLEIAKHGRHSRKRGMKLCLLVSDSNSCKSAYKFLRGFYIPAVDQIHLVTAINTEAGRAAALSRQQEILEPELLETAHYHVVLKEDDYSLPESLGRYVETVVRPHIIFMGSTNLCTNTQPTSSGPAFRPNQPAPSSFSPARPFTSAPTRSSSLPYGMSTTSSSSTTTSGSGTFFQRPLQRPQPSSAATAAAAPGPPLLGNSSLALRILPELKCAPVVLVKFNSKGAWLNASTMPASSSPSAGPPPGTGATSTGAAAAGAANGLSPSASIAALSLATNGPVGRMSSAGGVNSPRSFPQRPASALPLVGMGSSPRDPRAGPGTPAGAAAAAAALAAPAGPLTTPMRVMVDLQANSRHVLEWLFEHLTPGRDSLLLTVSQAFDDMHRIKPTAQRLLTAFGVQATVNSFRADTAVFPGPPNKSLPQAVVEGEPDLLVLQTPRCKGMPPATVEIMYAAKTSFLVWPPDYSPGPAR
ncbi:hypothetical protein Agub_g12902 [Astrephomene gubernaculifera]|uniref:Uncharacterized protein n=1 Tax=Astrephomene gubernaculifera TaxID=47775 RepID=A0AAD3DZF3_9CHLO|nr:hypothetical protein Agub_g12902 [Astrephomene gubernaculifera]